MGASGTPSTPLQGYVLGPSNPSVFVGQRGIDQGMQHVHAPRITGLYMLPVSPTWLSRPRFNTAQHIVQRPICTVRCHHGNVAPAALTRRSTLSGLAALFMQPALRARADPISEQVHPDLLDGSSALLFCAHTRGRHSLAYLQTPSDQANDAEAAASLDAHTSQSSDANDLSSIPAATMPDVHSQVPSDQATMLQQP